MELLTWNPVNRRCTDLFMKLKNMSLASIYVFFFPKTLDDLRVDLGFVAVVGVAHVLVL